MPSDNAVKAMTAPETAEVIVTLLSLYVDDENILNICDDRMPLTSGNIKYTPWGFRAVMPDQSEDARACRLQIDNTDLTIARHIKSHLNRRIKIVTRAVMASSPDIVEQGPFEFVLRNVHITAQSIIGELVDSYMADRKFSNYTYSPGDFPGLYF